MEGNLSLVGLLKISGLVVVVQIKEAWSTPEYCTVAEMHSQQHDIGLNIDYLRNIQDLKSMVMVEYSTYGYSTGWQLISKKYGEILFSFFQVFV